MDGKVILEAMEETDKDCLFEQWKASLSRNMERGVDLNPQAATLASIKRVASLSKQL